MSNDQKPEHKSLAQNKCLNEKRRREQENIYIEELAELISASITDMNTLSVKPDKCAILQETVNQIRRIKEEESGTSEAVQQSQVSSSKPSIIANDVLGPLLLEALDGFLFVVNSHGKVEFVSENVTSYLKYSLNDLVEKSIYNIIHVGDHAQFSNSLLPMSLAHTGTTSNSFSDDNGGPFSADTLGNKGRTFNCRMLIKPPCEEDGDVEVKQTYVSKYENMQISAVLQPYPDKQDNSTEGQSCLVCVARRLPLAEKTMLGIEQFTTKQDLNGKIVDCDTRGIAPSHYDYPDFKGHNLQDFCHVNDIHLLAKHIQEVKKNSQGTSGVYRFKLLENRYVFVRTQSQQFNDFIVSTHSIIRECDSDAELKGSASTSLMKSIIGPSGNSSSKASGHFQGVTSSLQGMGMLGGRNLNMYLSQSSLGAAVPPAPQSTSSVPTLGDAASITDMLNLNDMFDMLPQSLNQLFSSSDTLNVSANSVNYTMAGATNSVTMPSSASSSSHTTWSSASSLKMAGGTMEQPQLQRSLSMAHSNMSGPRPLSLNFQRSASLFDNGQKSPAFTGTPGQRTCSPNFAMPSPRGPGYGSYMNQRSPGSANQGDANRASSQFSPMSYPQAKSTSPLMSPQPSGNWSRPPSSGGMEFPGQSQNPLQALQSMDTNPPPGGYKPNQSPIGGSREKQFVYLTSRGETHSRRTSVEKKVNQSAKLTQLLTQNNPPPAEKTFCQVLDEVDQPISYKTEPFVSKMGLIRSSLRTDSQSDNGQQSPQPGPGSSPQEKPQSTSGNDEHDVKTAAETSVRRREENKILKQLLSQDDDLDDDLEKGSHTEQKMDVDKNEAEPKKANNVLLKQLLNEEAQNEGEKDEAAKKLQKLLREEVERDSDDDPYNIDRSMSAPVESSSLETESFGTVTTSEDTSRQRHQSGPQQPTSTTQPTAGPLTQPKNGSVILSPSGAVAGGSNLLKNFFSQEILGQADNQTLMQGNAFRTLLTNLWEKGNTDSQEAELRPMRNKRKLPTDVDSTDDMDTEPTTSSGPSPNLSKRNVMLAKLLARKPPQETVINTNITVNPCGIPQTKVAPLRNVHKMVHVLDKVDNQEDAMDTGKVHNPRDNPRTNPNVPFPGNTTPATAGQRHQQSASIPGMFGGVPSDPNASEAQTVLRQGLANLSNEQLLRCQQELSLRRSGSGAGVSNMSMEVDTAPQDGPDPSDPLLAQILQQAQDLQNDLNSGSLNNVSSSAGPMENNSLGSMMDDSTLLSQLDMVLKDSNLSMMEIDNLLGISNQTSSALMPSDMSEQMAISAIQKQLMSDSVTNPTPNSLPPTPSPSSTPMAQQPNRLPSTSQAFAHSLLQQQQQQQQQHPPNTQLPPMDLPFPHGQQMAPQQPGLSQSAPGYGQQGPRLPQPQALGSALANNQPRPGFTNLTPSSTAFQVRQSILMQQKQKQMREMQKRERIHQQRQQQQLLLRQQHAQQYNQQFPQRFQNTIGMDSGNGQSFPENLGELMKSGNAPNVTLPRNQSLPNPMSPRFVSGNMPQNQQQQQQQQQQQTLQNMISSNTPPPQLSPHYNQPKAGPGQWAGSRVNQSGMQSGMLPSPTMNQNSQFGMRSRQLSGSSMPSPGGQPAGGRFPYPSEAQFNNGQGGQMGMYSQPQGGMSQQQAMFNQNRIMQRQLNVSGTGRGSPRTPHSPYGGGGDPMLMSPHSQTAMSPNPSLRTQQQVPPGSQLSPQFNQNSLSQSYSGQTPLTSNYSQSPSPSMAGSFSPMTSSAYAPSPQAASNVPLTNQPGFQDFDISMFTNNLAALDNKGPGSMGADIGNLGNNPTSSTSQYVKQELRNICNARSEKQLQTQQPHPSPLEPQHPDQLQQALDYDSNDAAYNSILDEIDQMTQQHNLNPLEDNVVQQSRQEARRRIEQFRQLSHPAVRQATHYPAPQQPPEDNAFKQNPEIKATNLFRNQLLSNPPSGQQANKGTTEPPHHVNVVQKEPRAPCEDMKPADQKNSLLQQLLSE